MGSTISPKAVLTVCATATGFLGLLLVVWRTPIAITLTFVALLVAVALDHAVLQLGRLGVPRALAIAVVTVASLGGAAGVGALLVPPILVQVRLLLREALRLIE